MFSVLRTLEKCLGIMSVALVVDENSSSSSSGSDRSRHSHSRSSMWSFIIIEPQLLSSA